MLIERFGVLFIMLFCEVDKRLVLQTDETFKIVHGIPISYCLCIVVAFPTHLTLLFSRMCSDNENLTVYAFQTINI